MMSHVSGDNTRLALPSTAAMESSYARALEPNDFDSAWKLACIIEESGMFAPKGQKCLTRQQATMRIMTGRSLGVPAIVALNHIYDLYGRTALSAALKDALVLRDPDCEKFEHVESDRAHCKWLVKRKGSPEQIVTYTIDDARLAQLVKTDSNWEKNPEAMCQARARTKAADRWFTKATMGLPSIEQVEEDGPGETVNQLTGEVTVTPDEKPPQVAVRDYDKEEAALGARIAAAVTPADFKAIREAVTASDIPESHLARIRTAYQAAHDAAKAARANGAPQAQP